MFDSLTPDARSRNSDDLIVAGNLRKIRIARQMSQQTLAAEIGVSYQQIQKYERGKDRLTVGRIVALAKVLQVEVAAFFDGIEGHKSIPVPSLSPGEDMLVNAYRAIISARQQKALINIAISMAQAED